MAKKRLGYMSVDVDLDEALDNIRDEDLLQEVEDRKLKLPTGPAYQFDPVEELKEVREELLRGRPAEALSILDRIINPKWPSVKACELAVRAKQ